MIDAQLSALAAQNGIESFALEGGTRILAMNHDSALASWTAAAMTPLFHRPTCRPAHSADISAHSKILLMGYGLFDHRQVALPPFIRLFPSARQLPFNPAILVQCAYHAISRLTPYKSAFCAISTAESILPCKAKMRLVGRCPSIACNVMQAKRHEKNLAFFPGRFDAKSLENQRKTAKKHPEFTLTILQLLTCFAFSVQFFYHAKSLLTHYRFGPCAISARASLKVNKAKWQIKNSPFFSGHFDGKSLGNQAKIAKKTLQNHSKNTRFLTCFFPRQFGLQPSAHHPQLTQPSTNGWSRRPPENVWVFPAFHASMSRRNMSKIVGIDLGTTNSLVATVDSGIPFVLADADGRRLTPSVVHYPSAQAAPVVGHDANRVRVLKPSETVYSVKRFIGRRGAEITEDEKPATYALNDGTGPVTIPIHGRNFSPEEISAEVLKKLKRDAENSLGEPVTRAVITVPAYFNDAQRAATKRAGELAGFTVERILNEPTAAALAYGLDKLKEKSKIAVYDLGGGTFDLSILELNEGVFQVLSTNGNTRLGGDDLDRRIAEFLVETIKRSSVEAGAAATLQLSHASTSSRIREAAEAAKIRLSTETETDIALPFLTPDFSFNYRLTRTELESLTRDIVARTRGHCLRALADAKLEAKDLNQVILVGGQTRMPLVRRFVAELFGCAEFTETRGGIRLGTEYHQAASPELNTSQNPDEAVALGAAIQAEILSGGFKNVLLLDVTPLSLGVETFGGLMNVLIPRNTTIPVKAGEMFTTAMDQQRSMLIHVLQGERERAKDNWSLGKFTIEFEPAARGLARVGVQFEIDANGILHVLARDVKTGKERIVEMKSAVDVDDTAVQKMVEESVAHAFDDLAVRRWIETKLKANDTLAATTRALVTCADEIDGDYRGKIEAAAGEVQKALATEDSHAGAGELKQLQAAVAALDEVTKPLAELLMDKAMEAMLKKRGIIQ